jgi:hypothetical protein
MNNRARPLLDLAHRLSECQNCGGYSPGCEPAHENGIAAGKGQSIKSQDNRHAALCHACHAWLDSGGNGLDPSGLYTPKREDKKAMWTRAHLRTFDQYWQRGWLRVAA